ncbi:hypothetical protein K3495_g357 [Podosphaera aphanis]|nr:hypothetical protein K3495_g357 [Podosphaera aphanis]
MEEQTQSNALAAAFPNPPPFYKYFTPTNIQELDSYRSTQSSSKNSKHSNPVTPSPGRIVGLSPELRFLLPPELPTPAEGKFRCFGDVYYMKEELPSLEAMGVEQVYTAPSTPSQTASQSTLMHHDRAFILKRLAKSLLLNFLELVGIMAINPSEWPEKVQDIRTIIINFHHLLNEYRPHQARESLILVMKEQLDRKRAEIRGIKECGERVEGILKGLGPLEQTEISVEEKKSEIDLDAHIWKTLDQVFEQVV